MNTYEIKASSLDKGLSLVYDRLLTEYGDNKTFRVQLRSVEIMTNCTTVFVYIFDVTNLGD